MIIWIEWISKIKTNQVPSCHWKFVSPSCCATVCIIHSWMLLPNIFFNFLYRLSIIMCVKCTDRQTDLIIAFTAQTFFFLIICIPCCLTTLHDCRKKHEPLRGGQHHLVCLTINFFLAIENKQWPPHLVKRMDLEQRKQWIHLHLQCPAPWR